MSTWVQRVCCIFDISTASPAFRCVSRKADAARHCLRHCLHHGRDDHREPLPDAPRQLHMSMHTVDAVVARRKKEAVSPLRRLVAQAALSAARECPGGHPCGYDDLHTFSPSGPETAGTVSVSRAHLGRVLQGSCPFVQGTQEPQTPTKRLTEFQRNVHAARREKGPQVAAFALAPASRPSSQSVSPHPSPVPVATGRCVCNGVDRGRRSTPKKLTGYDSPRAKTSPPEHGHFCRDSHTRNSSAAVSRFAQWQSRKTSRTSGSFASGIPVRLRLHACIPLSRGYDRIHGSEESACCANARANTLAGGKGPLRPHQGQAGIGGIEVDVC